MLSRSGQCKTFTAEADGYVRGEGCGILILKRLEDAERDGNKVWANIYTGTNQDGGNEKPITAPSKKQQKELLQDIYETYQIDKSCIQVIEAHGTGTEKGDPVEVNALGEFFSSNSNESNQRNNSAFIGSVKTNVGHLEAAAGVAGLFKVLLMMNYKLIVPSLWYTKENENPKLNLSMYGFIVPTTPLSWDKVDGKGRMACVNSFGFGGTNAHVIVEEHTVNRHEMVLYRRVDSVTFSQKQYLGTSIFPYIITLSATDDESLFQNIKSFHESLRNENYDLHALSCTSTCKRDHRQKRKAFVATSEDDLLECCQRYLSDPQTFDSLTKDKNIVFVFCGIGTASNAMCKRLVEHSLFLETLKKIDECLEPLTNWSIERKFRDGISGIEEDPLLAHIAIFSCQICLIHMWKHIGVIPDIVIGQSVGEVAAAFAGGHIDMRSAVEIIYHRSKFLAEAPPGEMIVIQNVEVIKMSECIQNIHVGTLAIAVFSSATCCTVSGDSKGIKALKREISSRYAQAKVTDLEVQCAYHSPLVEESADKLKAELMRHSLSSSKETKHVKMISTTFETKHSSNLDLDLLLPSYWKDNMRRPVQFEKAIKSAFQEDKYNIYIEIGPRPVLRAHAKNIFADTNFEVFPSLVPEKEEKTLIETTGLLYQQGMDISWNVFHTCSAKMTDIPSYRFKEMPNLHRSQTAHFRNQGMTSNLSFHPYLKILPPKDGCVKLRALIGNKSTSFLYEHKVRGKVILPGAFYVDIGYEIARVGWLIDTMQLSISVEFLKTVQIEEGKKIILEASSDEKDTSKLFHVFNGSQAVCRGWVKRKVYMQPYNINIEALKTSITSSEFLRLSKAQLYQQLHVNGFEYRDSFQIMQTCLTNGTESLTKIKVGEYILGISSKMTIHPCLLDGMLQTTTSTMSLQLDTEVSKLLKKEKLSILPVAIEDVAVFSMPKEYMTVYTKVVNTVVLETMFSVHYNILLLDDCGNVVVELKNFTLFSRRSLENRAPCLLKYEQIWKPLAVNDKIAVNSNTLVILSESIILPEEFVNSEDVSYIRKNENQSLSSFFESVFCYASNRNIETFVVLANEYHVGRDIDPGVAGIISDKIKDNCLFIAALFKSKAEKNDRRPVFVVTQNTQVRDDKIPQTENLFGAELWGFVRSVNSEFIYGSTTLVDVQPSLPKTFKVLLKYISYTLKDIDIAKPEIIVTQDGVYASELMKGKISSMVPRLRKTTSCSYQLDTIFSVNSVRSKYMEDCFLVQTDNCSPLQTKKNQMEIRVEKACVHPLSVNNRTTKESHFNSDIWKDTHDNGHKILALEYIGRVENQSVIALFPAPLQTKMTIPKSTTIALAELPVYRPGLLYTSVICWEIINQIKQANSVVFFDTEGSGPLVGKILQNMVAWKSQSTVFHIINEETEQCKLKNHDVFVTLGELDVSSHCLKNSKRVICLQRNILDQTKLFFLGKWSGKEIIILEPEKIFHEINVSKIIKPLTKWLKQNIEILEIEKYGRFDMKGACQQSGNYMFPCRTLDIQNLTLPVGKSLKTMFGKEFTYIVTGGLTGLGFEIVKLLSEMGAGNIITLNRRKISSEKGEELRRMETDNGCLILSLQADVNDFSSLESAMQDIERICGLKTLKGVFHCAGVLSGKTLINLQEEELDKVLKPKVLGTLNMHVVTKKAQLDFFVVSSSVSSFIGIPGQSNYGAANCFQDAFIRWRRLNGFAGQTIHWGALSVGMASWPAFTENLKKRGYELLTVPEIRSCLQEALLADLTGTIYQNVNWRKVAEDHDNAQMARARLILENIFTEEVAVAKTHFKGSTMVFDLQSLANKDEASQKKAIEEYVMIVFSKVIGTTEQLRLQTSLGELGLDSMSTLTMINLIQESTGYKLDSRFMLDQSKTINDVVMELQNNVLRQT
ncbi:uncharacterized protein LOC123565498 [Mercenaria mercenaria]|uniref:uncharacterized protein LOC123565498 n=1 Tax=Mercenaria mercenaria TaxID=6596 RepID=UPI00234F1068|nr:uncharacterized protein LOC123565498 [Mercenaria mercenaria]